MIEVGSKLVEQFAQNLRQLIAEDGGAGGNAAATATDEADSGTSAGQAAAETGAAGASQDGPGSTQPSPVVPAAATTSTPTAPTPTAQPPVASADSINLIKLVGPSLLKRVIPAAVAAAGLALLGRWLFRRNAKG
jgi:hypothetical protein